MEDYPAGRRPGAAPNGATDASALRYPLITTVLVSVTGAVAVCATSLRTAVSFFPRAFLNSFFPAELSLTVSWRPVPLAVPITLPRTLSVARQLVSVPEAAAHVTLTRPFAARSVDAGGASRLALAGGAGVPGVVPVVAGLGGSELTRAGVTTADAADGGPVAVAFVAVTVNVYAVPLDSPVTVHWSGPEVHVHSWPPGDAVTV